MRRPPPPLQLFGAAWMLAGALMAGLPLLNGASTAAPGRPAVVVRISAGPALLDRPTTLGLRLSTAGTASVTGVAVTDLVPSGLTYVAGSSVLTRTGRADRRLADPREVATSRGTLLVWSSLRVDARIAATSLVLEVAAAVAPGARPAASAALPRTGAATATTGPGTKATTTVTAPSAKPAATAAGLTTGSVWSDQATAYAARSGRAAPHLSNAGEPVTASGVLTSTARRSITVVAVSASQVGRLLAPAPAQAAEHLEEHLTIMSTPAGPTRDVTVRLDVPGSATWAGCVPATACLRPTVADVRLPVTSALPDQPHVPRAASAPSPTALARFTVLTWHLGTLRAGTDRVISYRLDAAAIARPRTQDLVTASGAVTVLVAGPRITWSPLAARVAEAAPTVEATFVQSWPAAPVAATAVAAGATTVVTSSRDPFSGSGATTTTTTSRTGAATTTSTTSSAGTTTTTSTTVAKGKLATTGSDVVRTTQVGLGLSGAGALLVAAGRRRRPRSRDAAGPQPSGDGR